jgi:hypothetical protein
MPIRKGKRTAQRIKRIREAFAATRDAGGLGDPAKAGASGWNNVEAYIAVEPPFDQFDQFKQSFDQFINFVQWEK